MRDLRDEGCGCSFEWKYAVGKHDTVTGEWLPDAEVVVVTLKPKAGCPFHYPTFAREDSA